MKHKTPVAARPGAASGNAINRNLFQTPQPSQLPGNRLGYGAFMRALLVTLFEWVEHGTAPPDSRFPSRAAGTLVPLAEARRTFPRLPEVKFPNVLNELRLRDHSVEPPSESTADPVSAWRRRSPSRYRSFSPIGFSG
jgi:hypothetical protein